MPYERGVLLGEPLRSHRHTQLPAAHFMGMGGDEHISRSVRDGYDYEDAKVRLSVSSLV